MARTLFIRRFSEKRAFVFLYFNEVHKGSQRFFNFSFFFFASSPNHISGETKINEYANSFLIVNI